MLVIIGKDHSQTKTNECFSYNSGNNKWLGEPSLSKGLIAAAASNSPRGWMISGGASSTNARTKDTRIFADGAWQSGPKLPKTTKNHCQVEADGTVYVIGYYL